MKTYDVSLSVNLLFTVGGVSTLDIRRMLKYNVNFLSILSFVLDLRDLRN